MYRIVVVPVVVPGNPEGCVYRIAVVIMCIISLHMVIKEVFLVCIVLLVCSVIKTVFVAYRYCINLRR